MKKLQEFLQKFIIAFCAFVVLVSLSAIHLNAAEKMNEQPVGISSFITPAMQEITISEKETVEEVKKKLPEALEAVTAENENIYIPVTWECVGDYDETNYFYYQFKPIIDRNMYDLPEELDIPYIWLLISPSENLTRAVTSSANETTIYNFLVNELNCNLATAVGILANIERESSFNPQAKVTSKGEILYYGICQWGNSRFDDLKNYCSEHGYSYETLEGQLNFLKYELYGSEISAWKKMQGIEDSAEGAYLAGYNWARYFERCAAVYYEVSAIRARDVYWPEYAAETEAPVYRISGATRYETGMKIANQLKEVLDVEKFEHVVIATGTGFADALSGSYLAYVKNAPILLTNGRNMTALKNYIDENLDAAGTIYLLGGEGAISETVEAQLTGYEMKRLAGETRYETNLEILKEAGITDKELLVCTGKGFADSLSASAAGKPILLVADELNEEQKTYLESLELENVSIIGGEGAVNAVVEAELKAYGTCRRIGGTTRYETSVMVAEAFVTETESAVLAYSGNFPDGLCGGPFAAKLNAPLVLTKTGKENAATGYIKNEEIREGFVLGGTGLISDGAVKKIFDLKASDRITAY